MAMDNMNVTFDETNTNVQQAKVIDDEILKYFITGFKLVLNPTLSIAGGCTNVINAAVYLKLGLIDGVNINFFILSVSDGLYALASVINNAVFIADSILKNHRALAGSKIDAQLVFWGAYFAYPITQTISIIVTVVIAVVRCFSVVMPLHVKSILTTKRQIAATLVLSAIPTAVYLYAFQSLKPHYVSSPQTNVTVAAYFVDADSAAYIATIHTSTFVGLVIIGVCAVVLSVSLKRYSRFREASRPGQERTCSSPERKSKDKRRDARVVQTVMMVSAAFILFNLIPCSYLILYLTLFDYGTVNKYRTVHGFLLDVVQTCGLSNVIVNISIYYLYNRRYRSTLLAMVRVTKDPQPR